MTAHAIEAVLDKRYGACVVLRAATLAVRPCPVLADQRVHGAGPHRERGTVHALVGENGAGKSTLVKILAGVVRADHGSIRVHASAVELARWDRKLARAAGIGIVQQHGASAETLTVVENAVLGVEGGMLLDLAPVANEIVTKGTEVGLPVDPHAEAGALSLGAAQRAELVAALRLGAKLLILDEPTAVLAPVEVEGLLATLRRLAASGTSVVIVTHKLDEVRAVADDVTVLRAGATVATFSTTKGPLDTSAIARAMVGTDLPPPTPVAAPSPDAKVALALRDVTLGPLRDVALDVRAGEIVGVAGVDGNGQRELALAIAGLERVARGTVLLGGREVTQVSPAQRFAAGLAHVPEDRHHGGLLLDATIADNLALGRADITGRFRVNRARVLSHAHAQIEELDIRPADPAAIVRALSGGNQQKVVIGRELSRPNLRAVVACQPTRGVDLGAVARIHDRLRAAAIGGAGVLVISADLDELLALCHRIVVVLRGRIVGEHASGPAARSALGALMTGAA